MENINHTAIVEHPKQVEPETHEEPVSMGVVMFNVGIQIINLVIFFLLLKYFLGDKIANALSERKKLINKLKNADLEYTKKIEEAKQEKKKIIEEAIVTKNKIIEDAKIQAGKIKENIINQAEQEKNNIIEKAQEKIKLEQKELEEGWIESVKQTTMSIFDKLTGEKEIAEKYIEKILITKK